ncbi:hypothetical protein AGABI2DRAFT_119342 [Agaricus bisporus var. bisporus H97]|uniref:hypothetical protein n=1 Tax=Agaricus bisporus var. bisporus (strain H97 / ATCC MYA-4626 / FGSC 10389) TaxID=936046 RepID=UPI00029F5E10|nr:hypothetical protein AGABI2DRAFT_119342 [Agaricus bisporus var. bisporus H97]EKV45663.1 hypothetical protein AGABI2DRAFT_119342 [Agaricus bisporus var. bisporus H97]
MPPSIVKSIRLFFLIIHIAQVNAQANKTIATARVQHDGPASKKLIIAAATIAPGLAFSIIFVMAILCRRPFGNTFVLRTPTLLLGASDPPFEDASSLGIKFCAVPPDTPGEANV